MSPFILYSDGKGNIFEDQSLFACGRSGWDAVPVDETDRGPTGCNRVPPGRPAADGRALRTR